MMLLMSKIMIKKYIKKQFPVEAVLWDGTNFEEVKKFIIQNNPDEIVHEFVDDTLCTGSCCIFRYKKGGILFYDKKKEKDVFKYGKDRLNDKSVFGVLPLGYYVYFDNEKGYHETVSKAEFEAEYEQQDSNHTSKSSNFSLRDLVLQIAPKHIKYYIKRLEEYGFKLKYINEAEIKEESAYIPFTVLEDKNGHRVSIVDRDDCIDTIFGFDLLVPNKDKHTFTVKNFEVKNNNWREAFKKLIASFPDEIMKNTNHHASLSS